jgi:hypothetical protein
MKTIRYHIRRIRLLKQNGHTEVLKTINCDLYVTDLEQFREQLKLEHNANRVHLNFSEIRD